MSWNIIRVEDQRWRFVWAALRQPARGFAALCRQFGISRRCGYKWVGRAAQFGRSGLTDRSRRPRQRPGSWPAQWRQRCLQVQQRNRRVGARKVRALLQRQWPARPVPSERTLHRWLTAAGRTRPARPLGVWRCAPPARAARQPNDVWTVDFKGWFRTGDGVRIQALTVRDLASRYVLLVRHLARPDEGEVARAFRRLFRRHGLPRAIRFDRGAPFAGVGPRHWSRLSVGWLRLGIALQITRRARPQDNGGHEQMHRILKAETATPPAPTVAAQQTRFDRWRLWYNLRRPHASLGQRPPAQRYHPSPRHCLRPAALQYPPGWLVFTVKANGEICWRGTKRQIGRAFWGQRIGLRPGRRHAAVYFGATLLGHLRATDRALRAVRLRRAR